MAIIGFTIVYGLYVNETALGFDRAGGNRQVWLSTCDTVDAPWTAVSSASWFALADTSFSHLGQVTLTAAPMLAVSPNPASASVTLSGLTPGLRVKVYDATGREWLSVESYGTTATLDISRWPRGVYVVESTGCRRSKLVIE